MPLRARMRSPTCGRGAGRGDETGQSARDARALEGGRAGRGEGGAGRGARARGRLPGAARRRPAPPRPPRARAPPRGTHLDEALVAQDDDGRRVLLEAHDHAVDVVGGARLLLHGLEARGRGHEDHELAEGRKAQVARKGDAVLDLRDDAKGQRLHLLLAVRRRLGRVGARGGRARGRRGRRGPRDGQRRARRGEHGHAARGCERGAGRGGGGGRAGEGEGRERARDAAGRGGGAAGPGAARAQSRRPPPRRPPAHARHAQPAGAGRAAAAAGAGERKRARGIAGRRPPRHDARTAGTRNVPLRSAATGAAVIVLASSILARAALLSRS